MTADDSTTETDPTLPDVPWRVNCQRNTGDDAEYQEVTVSEPTRDAAKAAARDELGDDWTPYDAEKLCIPCHAAPHPECEVYSELLVVDPERVPLGEDYEDHLVAVPMCLEHLEAIQGFLRGELL